MTRCPSVHDFNPNLERGLRCLEVAGHPGPCKPKAWERMTRAQYVRLINQPPRLREAK